MDPPEPAAPDAASTNWDPLVAALPPPTSGCLRRLGHELSGLRTEPLPGIQVAPDEEIATMVHALIEGPEGTPYEGGLFHFILLATPNYPHEPPLARFMTTGQQQVRFNPQFYTSGKVCLSILNTWPGPGWNPSFSFRVVLLQLQALMNSCPALNEPGVMMMSNPEEYNSFLRHETLRVAVLGNLEMAEETLRDEGSAPEPGAPLPPVVRPSAALPVEPWRDPTADLGLEEVQTKAGAKDWWILEFWTSKK
ncbi:Ubiquitin-conjugating enzyme E2 Z (E2 ubiquitin-conjugating enzyme Z) (Uba6-specific E2 conjugating enzyme 1) (Use1) (Ubiquitin carrier protein Z) (Ubiquitin-protein ligase Z) [Durusdinium trenchii]|uniref:Ubiquitin-conjugating enzyme E2 Z n=1 Tax=Durusdinium trenchii TaxID=1381693 RepID=A0ABP0SAW5_9DINO